MDTHNTSDLITADEAALRYGIGVVALRSAATKGRIPSRLGERLVPVGGKLRKRTVRLFRPDDVEAYVRRIKASAPFDGLVYGEYMRGGKIPPHLLTAFHVFVHAVQKRVDLSGGNSGNVAKVARMVRLVETDAQALAWEQTCGAMVRWGA